MPLIKRDAVPQNLNLPCAKISSDLSHRKDGRVMLKCSGSGVNSEKKHLQPILVCTYCCTCSQYRSTSSICTEGWRFPQSVKATHAIGLLTPKYSWAQVNHAEPNKLRKESTNTNANTNSSYIGPNYARCISRNGHTLEIKEKDIANNFDESFKGRIFTRAAHTRCQRSVICLWLAGCLFDFKWPLHKTMGEARPFSG